MHPRTRTQRQTRRASGRGGMAAALLAALVNLAPGVATAQTAAAPSLKELFETAWARQPESLSLQARRDAVQAQRRAAEAWTPEPPALEASHKTDRLTRNDGARELEVGVDLGLGLAVAPREGLGLADEGRAPIEVVGACRWHDTMVHELDRIRARNCAASHWVTTLCATMGGINLYSFQSVVFDEPLEIEANADAYGQPENSYK